MFFSYTTQLVCMSTHARLQVNTIALIPLALIVRQPVAQFSLSWAEGIQLVTMLALGPIQILNVGSVTRLQIFCTLVQMLAIRILDRLD